MKARPDPVRVEEREPEAEQIGPSLWRVALVVADDGPGFVPDEACSGGQLGLAYVREQAELLSGRSRIDSAPGRGTRVQVWLPSANLGGRRPTRAG